MTVDLISQQLYGGAIESTIPEGFIDLSDLREVPDTQEVFVTMEDGQDESLIFDLLERIAESDDKKALVDHVSEMAGLNESSDGYKMLMIQKLANTSSYMSISVSHARKWGRESDAAVKPILLVINGLIRLDKVTTDVLISFNIPTEGESATADMEAILDRESAGALPLDHWSNGGSTAFDKRILRGLEVVESAVKNFSVKDWGLFN